MEVVRCGQIWDTFVKGELTGFADRLVVVSREKKGVKDIFKVFDLKS